MQLGCIYLFFKGMQQILKQKIRLLNKRDENLEVIVSRRLRRFIGFVYIKISAYQFNPIYQRSLRHSQQPSPLSSSSLIQFSTFNSQLSILNFQFSIFDLASLLILIASDETTFISFSAMVLAVALAFAESPLSMYEWYSPSSGANLEGHMFAASV